MSMLIVPEPVFDANMAVEAYWLRSHDGEKMLGLRDNYQKFDGAFTTPGLDIVGRIGVEPFAGGKPLFADLSPLQLMAGAPTDVNIAPEALVCVIPAECAENEEAAEHIRNLRQKGYRLALEGLPQKLDTPVMGEFEFIALDYAHPQFRPWYVQTGGPLRDKKVVVSRVPDMEVFDTLKQNANTYFAGSFYSRPFTKKKVTLSPVKINTLHLLNQVNQEDFDLEDIVKTIEHDPYLSISLLRFINSSASGLRHQVESIQQAVAILGQRSVRQWATIAISASLGEDRPGEITKLSLVRAKFAESLATAFHLGVFQSGLFMAGLFSLLDVMLERPMEEALQEVAVNQLVKEALLEKKGPMAPVMEMVYAYERAAWDQVSILMIQNDTDMEHVSKAYLDSLLWYGELLHSIDDVQSEA